ncbi:tyrosine recombinase XerC [Amylibacter marinus]|uniref:Tyrosine recombinase XerC n=1 Tax=Amylibacter marinus TaxID=1475483 RepID=A0ABQ5VY04_9RHOB|nr:DUF484 family protein [Amylibacter marinus]GLQ36092.1 tyrosine recombinase XerC [Amylibacter marinus]
MENNDQLSEIRTRILADPDALLNDQEVMRALVSASDPSANNNVIDLKSVVLRRLEERLDEMEGQKSTILSAAYENISTTNQVHRAILEVLGPNTFTGFLEFLRGPWAESLQVSVARLCLEAPAVPLTDMPPLQREFGPGVVFLQRGEIDYYITLGRDTAARPITLRQVKKGVPKIHGVHAENIRSEALLKIDLGPGNRPGMIMLGSDNPDQFVPNMGTDLLVFYGSVFERLVQSWLAHE